MRLRVSLNNRLRGSLVLPQNFSLVDPRPAATRLNIRFQEETSYTFKDFDTPGDGCYRDEGFR